VTALPAEPEEFDGDTLAPLLGRAGGAALADALVGCRLYRDDPDEAVAVLRVRAETGRVAVRDGAGREREVALRGAYLLSGDGRLRAAVDALTTGADLALAADTRHAARFGFTGRIEPDDAARLAAAIRALEADVLEGEGDRRRTAMLAAKYGSARTVLRFTDQWLRLAGSPPPADVLIAHVKALRDASEIEQALSATEVVARPDLDHGLSPSALAVLLTQRAALWLDLFERRYDPELLARARAAAGRAHATQPSAELNRVYARLRRLEDG